MTLKPPTRTFPKLVMKDFDEEEMKILGALADLDDRDFFATVMGKKALSDFTRVVEETGILDQKQAP